MSNTIIALRGKSQTGKTTTLKKLIEIIKEKGHGVTTLEQYKNDIVIVVEINGKNVGITTRGDFKSYLATDFAEFEKWSCELFVCACRSKGETVDFLEKQSKGGTLIYHGEWYIEPKDRTDLASDIDKANTYQAQMIYDEIIRML